MDSIESVEKINAITAMPRRAVFKLSVTLGARQETTHLLLTRSQMSTLAARIVYALGTSQLPRRGA